jgi:2-oxoglutarate dehydrogenase E2 component (dihydrolipoamide succinyltransferase)
MAAKVEVPELGESVSEVQIAEWLKKPGDWVELDEPLVELESDKATVELPAPVAGRLTDILKQTGDFANVGDALAVIDETAERGQDEPAAAPRNDAAPAAEPAPAAAASSGGDAFVMPAARKALTEAGVPATQVTATGPGGRLLKEDVKRHLADKTATVSAPPTPVVTPQALNGDRSERVEPMSPIRRRIAERLVESQQTAALLTTFNEIDMSRVVAMRRLHQDAFRERYGVKLGFMSFFTKAAVEALQLIPQLNAEIQDKNIVFKNYFDIGIAVGGGKGLVVPVLRDAGLMGFGEIEQRIADFAARAQAKKIDPDELAGGTFTISNGGVYGSLLGTPIVNPPQSGVLGLHAIQDRPVVIDGEIQVRPMMYVALTYDHRIIDGREAATFLMNVKRSVENPERMMLQI